MDRKVWMIPKPTMMWPRPQVRTRYVWVALVGKSGYGHYPQVTGG